jgi:hypothetical protein
VAAVSADVCGELALITTEAGERLQVVGLVAPFGADVIAQVSATVPAKELDGVTVIVEVLPLVAPGLSVMLPLLERVKLVLLLGALQNPAHPVMNGTATSSRRAQFPVFISEPLSWLSC